MRRGDIVIVAAPSDFGKPRPAVVIQSDLFNDTHATIVVCLLTSDLQDAPYFRIGVEPTSTNGLDTASQIMADKVVALRRARVGRLIGRLEDETMVRLDRSLALFLGLAP